MANEKTHDFDINGSDDQHALYNIITIPLAFSGFAMPLMAALAMSLSSITVTLNAFRLPKINKGNARDLFQPHKRKHHKCFVIAYSDIFGAWGIRAVVLYLGAAQ